MRIPGQDLAPAAIVDSTRVLVARAKKLQAQSNTSSWSLADIYAELKNQGWTGRRIAEECEAEESHVSRFIACAKKFAVPQTRPPFWKAYEELHEKSKSVAFSSASNEWYTPKDYVEAARRVLGAIDLDPASCAKANETIKAARYFSEKDDGLSQPWIGRLWLNPPYGKKEGESSAGVWAARLAEQYHDGNTKAAVLLVNASTEQKWFQPLLAEFPCCLTDHRIAFAVAGEEEPKSPISGNAFFYLGPDARRFADEFAPFGAIVRPFGSE